MTCHAKNLLSSLSIMVRNTAVPSLKEYHLSTVVERSAIPVLAILKRGER